MRSLATLTLLCLALPAAAAPMAPVPVATAGLTDAPPVVDGALDDACWAADAAVLEGFVELDFSALAPVQTTAYVCCDDERLYVAARCIEPNPGAIVAFMTEHDDAVWRDDCIEVFIDTSRDRQSYVHIIANSRGTIYDDATPGDSTWESGADAAAQVGEGEWTVELAIPLAALGGAPQTGDVWGFNIGRERQAGGANELSAWSPTYGKFLEPGRFGDLRFEAEPAWLSASLADEGTFGPRAVSITGSREVEPSVSLMRDWPEGLARTWPTPEPTVAAGGGPGQWTAQVRVVDGSETGLIIEQRSDNATLARQAFPIVISPRPRTALLARQVLSVGSRLAHLPALGKATAELLAQVTALLDGFVQGNLTRTEPMSQQEWAAQSGAQQSLLVRISGLSCVVWTQSPLLDLARDQAPPSLQPDPTISLRACGNEIECGAFIVSNLSAEMFEGRVTIDDLRLVSGEALAAADKDNLLTNGDFVADEDGNGIPDGWNAVGRDGTWALERLPDGSAAFALSGEGRTQVNFRQDVQLEAGRRYTLVAEI
ncbi:MAG: carbohydrate-binding family 9-like protein, partial [Armatimonadota bacterium]